MSEFRKVTGSVKNIKKQNHITYRERNYIIQVLFYNILNQKKSQPKGV